MIYTLNLPQQKREKGGSKHRNKKEQEVETVKPTGV